MKNKYISVLVLVAALSFSSCEKNLDIAPRGEQSEESYWTNAAAANAAVKGMYAELVTGDGSEALYGRGLMWFIVASDDMVIGRSRPNVENMKNFTANGDEGEIKRMWTFPWRIIKRANDIIRNIDKVKDMDEKTRNRIKGEAYFMSGMMYYQLSYLFGSDQAGVPILDPMKPDDYNLPRAKSVHDNYVYCEDLFTKAAALLPEFSALTPAELGRAHKTAALAYLAKTYLYDKQYQLAEQAAAEVAKSHHLLNSFADVFKIQNNWSSEYIWSVVSNKQYGSMLPGVMLENRGWGKYNGWGYYQPTKELYNAYEAGDQRREATILKLGDKFTYFGVEQTYASINSLTGYQFNKYMEPFSYPAGMHLNPDGNFPTTDLNVPLMRFAEVLLIQAEAKLMQGKSGDDELNLIRLRAGLGKKTGMTMDDLKQQRRCELAGEFADRHFDLIRWGDAQNVYANPLHDINGAEVWKARKFNPTTHKVWPIPPSAISKSQGVLTPNPGW